MVPQQYCLRWKHHHTNVQNMFAQLLEKERFCDVTLYCSPSFATQVPNKDTVDPQNIRGVSLRAHRVVLAACSELLGALLGAHEAQGEPVLVIDGAEPRHLKALLDYMYTGEMNVHHSQLASLLKTAEELRIKGLTDIRWNNKDEPPDCDQGVVTATATHDKRLKDTQEKSPERKNTDKIDKNTQEHKNTIEHLKNTDVKNTDVVHERPNARRDDSDTEINVRSERFNVNGGPPPLIKLPTKEKSSPIKRENSDTDSPSPKRKRVASGTDHTDDESISQPKSERDQEWQHGNLDITAERVVGWGISSAGADSSRDMSDDEWADAPADIGCFLHTKLRVDGDNSADEESNDAGEPASTSASTPASAPTSASSACTSADIKIEMPHTQIVSKTTSGPKSGPTDPRFTDVVKLNDYLQHGRRPQFWEENYVKRVMEAVRMKELEMKQAAEILGVSYGTLYGRYRDVYGCINRPYRGTRDYWQSKGPSEVLERFQRGEITLDAASLALGVSTKNLAAYVADFGQVDKDFEPIPIEIDPSLKLIPRTYSGALASLSKTATIRKTIAPNVGEKGAKKIIIGNLNDDDQIPATVITTHEGKSFNATSTTMASSGKWPTIRVASLETLRNDPATSPAQSSPSAPATSPSQLMKTRPDLTIVAARKPEPRREDDET